MGSKERDQPGLFWKEAPQPESGQKRGTLSHVLIIYMALRAAIVREQPALPIPKPR